MSLALTDQFAKFHQRRGGIAKGKECIRMLLDSETDASLSTGKALPQPFPKGGEFS